MQIRETFTRESIRQNYHQKIQVIPDQGGGVDEIVNYLMSRISMVISYEGRKMNAGNCENGAKTYGSEKNERI